MDKKPQYILDSFALIAYLENEPAADQIEKILNEAQSGKCHIYISIINLGEAIYSTERRHGFTKAQETLLLLNKLPIEILPADDKTVLAAAHIKANYSISYADAFVVVAAQKINGVIMTGDPEFEEVTKLVQIEWLKRKK